VRRRKRKQQEGRGKGQRKGGEEAVTHIPILKVQSSALSAPLQTHHHHMFRIFKRRETENVLCPKFVACLLFTGRGGGGLHLKRRQRSIPNLKFSAFFGVFFLVEGVS
jgi:hypothetical protein